MRKLKLNKAINNCIYDFIYMHCFYNLFYNRNNLFNQLKKITMVAFIKECNKINIDCRNTLEVNMVMHKVYSEINAINENKIAEIESIKEQFNDIFNIEPTEPNAPLQDVFKELSDVFAPHINNNDILQDFIDNPHF